MIDPEAKGQVNQIESIAIDSKKKQDRTLKFEITLPKYHFRVHVGFHECICNITGECKCGIRYKSLFSYIFETH